MSNTIMFGYAEEQLPEAALENEADLFFYQMANHMQELGLDKYTCNVCKADCTCHMERDY